MEFIQHFINNKPGIFGVTPYTRYQKNGCVHISDEQQCTMIFTIESADRSCCSLIRFGWSKFNPKDKNFDRKQGLKLARARLRKYNIEVGIPVDLPKELHTVFLFHFNNMLLSLHKQFNEIIGNHVRVIKPETVILKELFDDMKRRNR